MKKIKGESKGPNWEGGEEIVTNMKESHIEGIFEEGRQAETGRVDREKIECNERGI